MCTPDNIWNPAEDGRLWMSNVVKIIISQIELLSCLRGRLCCVSVEISLCAQDLIQTLVPMLRYTIMTGTMKNTQTVCRFQRP